MPGFEEPGTFQLGDWVVDPSADELVLHGKATRLEPRTMRLLVCLARSGGQVVSSRRLLDEVWAGVVVSPGSLYEAISQLRRILGDSGSPPRYIATVPRKGYRLVASVSRVEAGPCSPTPAVEPAEVASRTTPAGTWHAKPHGRGAGIVVLALLAAAAVAWFGARRPSASAAWRATSPIARADRNVPGVSSALAAGIAVLPFADLSQTQDQRYLADGVAEEILDLLGRIPHLRTVGRTSSFQFRNTNLDVRTMGARLGAAYILEGSVRRAQDLVRVTVQLIDAHDGMHRWSHSYDRRAGDLLQLQADIAAAVARAIQVTVDGVPTPTEARGIDPRAYELFLRARYALDRSGREGIEEGIGYLEQALQLQPTFARAAAQLAVARCDVAFDFDHTEPAFSRAHQALEFAQRLNPRSGAVHAYLAAFAQFHAFDMDTARAELEHALQAEAPTPATLVIAGVMAMSRGRVVEAARYMHMALDSDPLNSGFIEAWQQLLLYTGRYHEAWEAGQRVLALSPDSYLAPFYQGQAALALGDTRAALASFERAGQTNARLAGLAAVHFAMGHLGESNEYMRRLERAAAQHDPYLVALAHAYRREGTAAMDWLERARRRKDANLASGRGDPAFDPYVANPRYRAVFAAMYPSG